MPDQIVSPSRPNPTPLIHVWKRALGIPYLQPINLLRYHWPSWLKPRSSLHTLLVAGNTRLVAVPWYTRWSHGYVHDLRLNWRFYVFVAVVAYWSLEHVVVPVWDGQWPVVRRVTRRARRVVAVLNHWVKWARKLPVRVGRVVFGRGRSRHGGGGAYAGGSGYGYGGGGGTAAKVRRRRLFRDPIERRTYAVW